MTLYMTTGGSWHCTTGPFSGVLASIPPASKMGWWRVPGPVVRRIENLMSRGSCPPENSVRAPAVVRKPCASRAVDSQDTSSEKTSHLHSGKRLLWNRARAASSLGETDQVSQRSTALACTRYIATSPSKLRVVPSTLAPRH